MYLEKEFDVVKKAFGSNMVGQRGEVLFFDRTDAEALKVLNWTDDQLGRYIKKIFGCLR